MKKTFLSVTAALAVIGSACAVPTVSEKKSICESRPDKYVWVERDEFCAPNNPCKSNSGAIHEAYCSTVFKDIQLGRHDNYRKLIETYLKNFLGVTGEPYGKTTTLIADDYVAYKLSDGGYIVFEFDDLSDVTKADRRLGAVYGACLAYGGYSSYTKDSGVGNMEEIKRASYGCKDLSKGTCEDVAELASSVLGQPMRVLNGEIVKPGHGLEYGLDDMISDKKDMKAQSESECRVYTVE